MGFFGGSETNVSTSVQRVIDDEQVQDPLMQGVINAIFGTDSVSEGVVESLLNSSAIKAEQMYRYAARGEYYYGLPSTDSQSEQRIADAIRPVLDSVYNTQSVITSAYVGSVQALFYAKYHCSRYYGYDAFTQELNTLSHAKGSPVVMTKIVGVYAATSADDIDFSTISADEYPAVQPVLDAYNTNDTLDDEASHYARNRATAAYEKAESTAYNSLVNAGLISASEYLMYDLEPGAKSRAIVHYAWVTEPPEDSDSQELVLHTDYLEFDLPALVQSINDQTVEDQVLQVVFNDTDGRQQFWLYELGSGTHPSLDDLTGISYTRDGTFFPFAIIRRNFDNRSDEKYADTEAFKSTKRLLSYLDIDFAAMGAAIHENEDINDVRQAALIMGVPLNTSDPLEAQYLHRYFGQFATRGQPLTGMSISRGNYSDNEQHKSYRDDQGRFVWSDADFSMALGHEGIRKYNHAETIGDIGTFTVERRARIEEYTATYSRGGDSHTETRTRTEYDYYIKEQISLQLCSVVYIRNPVTGYDIDYKRTYYSTQDTDILLIPLDHEVTKHFSISDRSQLYSRSLHLIFNAWVRTSLKWYETGLFKLAMIIIAVVAFAFGLADLGVYAASLAAAGYTALEIAILVALAIVEKIIISYAFRLVVKEIDPEIALAISVALIAYGGYQGVTGDLSDAMALTQMASNIVSASNYRIEEDMKALVQEGKELSELKNEHDKEIEKALELLGPTSDLLNPFMFIGNKPSLVLGETPNDFYNRTIDMPSTIEMSYKSVENFVDVSLTLPKTSAIIGDTL